MGGTAIFRSIGTLHGTGARLILSDTVNVVFGFDDMLALGQTVEEEVCRIVARRTIVTALPVIAAELFDRLQAGCTFVLYLYEIKVALALDGQADGDARAYF